MEKFEKENQWTQWAQDEATQEPRDAYHPTSYYYRQPGQPDPHYPFRTEIDAYGRILYFTPVEATSTAPVMTKEALSAAKNGGTHWVGFSRKWRIPVVFHVITDRDWAYDQVHWLFRELKKQRHRETHVSLVEQDCTDETWERIRRLAHSMPVSTDGGFVEAEYADVIEQILDSIREKHRKDARYERIYRMALEETRPEDMARLLGMEKERNVYYIRSVVWQIATEYREKYLEE